MEENEQTTPANDTTGTGQATGITQAADRTFTQADVNQVAGKARDEGRKAAINELTQKYGDLDVLAKAKAELDKKKVDEMTELEKAQARAAQLEQEKAQAVKEASDATLKALRLEIGLKKGLSPLLADRLTGSTPEEMEADADALLASLPTPQAAPPRQAIHMGATDGTAGGGSSAKPNLTRAEKDMAAKLHMTEEQYANRKRERMVYTDDD
jgi:hypothetical protein